ncbi:9611_t:CDS:2, partial [Racocetra persica]
GHIDYSVRTPILGWDKLTVHTKYQSQSYGTTKKRPPELLNAEILLNKIFSNN